MFDDEFPTRCQLHNAPLIEACFPIVKKTRRANFHRTLLWATSDYQARSPWTGGNHLVRDPDYTVAAKQPPIRAPEVSGASPKMYVAWKTIRPLLIKDGLFCMSAAFKRSSCWQYRSELSFFLNPIFFKWFITV